MKSVLPNLVLKTRQAGAGDPFARGVGERGGQIDHAGSLIDSGRRICRKSACPFAHGHSRARWRNGC
jgi:hypothetical protein